MISMTTIIGVLHLNYFINMDFLTVMSRWINCTVGRNALL
jgi:hypothetical protein